MALVVVAIDVSKTPKQRRKGGHDVQASGSCGKGGDDTKNDVILDSRLFDFPKAVGRVLDTLASRANINAG
jgi:hypothetical protein